MYILQSATRGQKGGLDVTCQSLWRLRTLNMTFQICVLMNHVAGTGNTPVCEPCWCDTGLTTGCSSWWNHFHVTFALFSLFWGAKGRPLSSACGSSTPVQSQRRNFPGCDVTPSLRSVFVQHSANRCAEDKTIPTMLGMFLLPRPERCGWRVPPQALHC